MHTQISLQTIKWFLKLDACNVRNILKHVVFSFQEFSHANHIKITIYTGDCDLSILISNSKKPKLQVTPQEQKISLQIIINR